MIPAADGVEGQLKGFLEELGVIWYNFPRPFPKSWEEVSRMADPA